MASRCTLASINVSSLSKRLEMILTWTFDVYVLSEVRLSHSAQRSVARRAASCGFCAFWSAPPPSSGGFAVPPGGVGVLVSSRFSARKVEAPEIHHWQALGRLVAVRISFQACEVLVLAIYGFPKSHDMYCQNEVMHAQVSSWIAGLNMAMLLAGDYNETTTSAKLLAMPDLVNLWKVSPDTTTTRDKSGQPSKNLAIDHILANSPTLDLQIRCEVRYDLWVTDHYPITASWSIVHDTGMTWMWPRPMKLCHKEHDPPWPDAVHTLTEWNVASVKWIAKAYSVTPETKVAVTTTLMQDRRFKGDMHYLRILALQSCAVNAAHMVRHPTDGQRLDGILPNCSCVMVIL